MGTRTTLIPEPTCILRRAARRFLDGRVWPLEDELEVRLMIDLIRHVTGAVLYTNPFMCRAGSFKQQICCDLFSVVHWRTCCYCGRLATTVSHFSGQVSSVKGCEMCMCESALLSAWLMLRFIAASQPTLIPSTCIVPITILWLVLVLVQPVMLL